MAWPGEAGFMARNGMAWLGPARQGKGLGEYAMKQYSVEITGINPLLIHRFSGEPESASRKIKVAAPVDTRAEAEKAANIAADGTHFISAFALVNAMAGAGSNHKMRGSRKSVRFVIPSAVRVLSADATCMILVDGKPATSFEVDARPVTIPATKGRIMRYRPRYERWSMRFELQVQDDLIDGSLVHQLLNEAGIQIGIGDFRPEKRGPFGTFRVTRWEELREANALAAE